MRKVGCVIAIFFIIIILLFKCIAYQTEEDYRYDEEGDSETLTLQGQRGLYVTPLC